MRWKWRRNQHVEEDDEDPRRWLLHKGDDEEHVEDVEAANFCHNVLIMIFVMLINKWWLWFMLMLIL